MKSFFSFLWDVVKITIITLVIVLPIRYFLAQPFFVKGASMEPNFDDGQYLVINEFGYKETDIGFNGNNFFTVKPFEQMKRGDVAIFRFPLDPAQFYIKRIIGLPGETVEVINGKIKIYNKGNPEGFWLDESKYLPDIYTVGEGRTVLTNDQYFVLGDNRSASYDSRRWGAVPAENIIGKVWLRVWPFSKATVFSTPIY